MSLIPSLFTFVGTAYSSARTTNSNLSDWYETSSALETATSIGSGASFTVKRQRISFRPQTFEGNLDGLQITHVQPVPLKARYLVYKIVNVKFKSTGVPIDDDRSALLNALQELLVITHAPLLQHPNIVDFLGLAWNDIPGSNHKVPVLCVEYAQHGSLAALQKTQTLTLEEKSQLVVNIGSGLRALHGCEIVHGDVKPDNVLVFDGETSERRYVAKVADFGFAMLSKDWPGLLSGSFLWSAPEIATRQIQSPQATDAFSFGLTVWSIYLDGASPLQRFAKKTSKKANASMVSTLKSSPELVQIAQSNQDIDPDFFTATLNLDPQARDLSKAVMTLDREGSKGQANVVIAPLSNTTAYQLFRSSSGNEFPISWHAAAQLDLGVQKFLVESLRNMTADVPGSGMMKPSLLFGLAAMQCQGIGIPQDISASTENIIAVARYGRHQGCRSIVYRACKTFNLMEALERSVGSLYIQWLEDTACRGSWAAQEDLRAIDSARCENAMILLRDRFCGVGANFFSDDQFINDLQYDDFLEIPKLLRKFKRQRGIINLENIRNYKVNKRGDAINHIAAACGRLDLLKWLLGIYPVLINDLNPSGESSLFHACRSGQIEVVRYLLSKGADASLEAQTGISCIHWLVQFDDTSVAELLAKLKENGANIEACALRPLDYVCHDFGVKFAYGEVFCRGTPVHWAVCKNRPRLLQELIAQGALFHPSMFPKGYTTKEENIPPNYLAAVLHHYECLEVIIDEFNKWRAGFTYGPLFCRVIEGGGLFSRVIRHGPDHEMFLRKTLEYLTVGSMRGTFFGGPDGQGNTLLTLAIGQGFEDVAVMLLDFPRWRAELNQPGGHRAMTPFHLAANRNMTKLIPFLISHGADTTTRGYRLSGLGDPVWTALHYFAAANHPPTSSILPLLLEHGYISELQDSESPLAVAIDTNNFALADHLLSLPSPPSLNALCSTGAAGHYIFSYPTTVLGRIIKTNASSSVSRLKFLFRHSQLVDLIVTPSLNFTALHEAARLNIGTKAHDNQAEELDITNIDMVCHREIWLTLLQHYRKPEELDAQVDLTGDTALHWAVMAGDDVGVEALLEAGARVDIKSREGLTPLMAAERIVKGWEKEKSGLGWERTRDIVEMLGGG